jgi:DeoR family transcriptional regulator of aga operon
LRPPSVSFVGEEGTNILDRYHLRKGYFGARGLTLSEGLTDPDQYGAETKRRMVGRSKEVIAVVDASKWGHVALATFASVEQINQVITDAAAPADMVAAMRELGIKVTLV